MRQALSAAAAALVIGLAVPAQAADDGFYKGKQVNLILSAGAGGGYDTYARAFAGYFGKHIPGEPHVVVQGMPGGGGIRAMNYLYEVAPKDGTTIGLVHSSVPFAQIYGLDQAKFDARKFNWLGALNNAAAMCVAWHQSGVTAWKDLFQDNKLIVGGTGAGSQMETLPAMLNKLFGTKIKIISGYKGGNDIFLAMERGEVNGRCGALVASINSTRPDWFPQKKVTVPIMISMERSPGFPDTPAIVEFAKDDKTRKVLELTLSPQEIDKPMLAPPGLAAARVATLRDAFAAASKDAQFLADAQKMKLDIDPVPYERVTKIVENAYAMPAEVIAAANDAMDMKAGGE
ncbi:MAG TPA: tripartite tricarboxylate transporter substrate-binding protein [Alphaproteobacteria bacterium]|nr:tripartite tricarboxylate transporter substrate-binding protein [Alphaproteobacteria bacterium]